MDLLEHADIEGRLPPIAPCHLNSLASAYGADWLTAAYCGFRRPPTPPPGIWQHGWLPATGNFDPAAVIGGYNDYRSVKETELFWVARQDQEEYLVSHGYRKTKAIGLPIVYLPAKSIDRIPGTLLVMPVHSLEYTNHSWNFDEYVDAISQIRDRFSNVVVCVHPSCWKRGYWVDAFRKQGIHVVQGARGDDRNGLLRLQVLLGSFEFMTTNGFGSHIAYAAYLGAKVSIYGPYAELGKNDYSNTELYQECPHILEPMLELTSETALRQNYPFFFCDPERASEKQAWGAKEVGLPSRATPTELRSLFGWTLAGRTKHKTSSRLTRLARKSRGLVRHSARYVFSPDYRKEVSEFPEVKALPAESAGSAIVYGKPFRFVNAHSFLFLYDEIIRRGIYRFATIDPAPLILDCGSNIGMSVVYFKHLHPNARIRAFEPDPTVFDVLSANCKTYGLADVELHQEAIWTNVGSLEFRREGFTLGSRLAASGDTGGELRVRTQRLRSLLSEKVALLKLDIEGAETEVLEDCAGALQNVERMFVEYHSFADQPQTIDRLLAIIREAGFRVHFHVYEPSAQPLFLRTIRTGIDLLDMNVDIFCYRS